MSFGDGNLRERVGDLNRQVDKLQRVNGELCAEINRQERRIRELEGTVDALGELAVEMARDLEDEPLGAWYADRLRKLGIGGR